MAKPKLSEMVCADCGTAGKMKKIKYISPDVFFDNEKYAIEGSIIPAGAPTHTCGACGAETGATARSKINMDIEMLDRVTGYAHWIPGIRGLYKEFFAENFPGWEWNDFVPRLIDDGVLQLNPKENENLTNLRFGLFISADIRAIEFTPARNTIKIKVFAKSEK
jgi:hypothetical protein